MKKHLSTILIILLIVIGVALLLYPSLSNYVNSKHASRIISDYNEAVVNAKEEEKAKILAEAEEYNRKIFSRPGVFVDDGSDSEYDTVLDISGTGIMGYIDIDKIGVEIPIYHGVSKDVLQIGAGHLKGSSLPVGGSDTHAVLSGHRGLPSAKLFTDLDKLEVGDEFTITVLDRVLVYRIDQIKIVSPEETEDLLPEAGKDYCTLITCTPYGINTHRLLVRGSRVESEVEEVRQFVSNEAFKVDTMIVAPIIALPLFILTIAASIVWKKAENKRRKKQ